MTRKAELVQFLGQVVGLDHQIEENVVLHRPFLLDASGIQENLLLDLIELGQFLTIPTDLRDGLPVLLSAQLISAAHRA